MVNGRWKSETRYASKRMAVDPAFALRVKTAGRINASLKKALRSPRKLGKSLDLLGCSAEEYRRHLEGLFEPGMTWENRGEWHIDHVRPIASHDLSTREGQRAAFHYTNTRPAWAHENLSKGSLWQGVRHRYG